MRKKIDWELEFDNFLEKNRKRKFRWGSWDCILFSNACVKAYSGKSLLPKEWRTWKNKSEALESIVRISKGKGLVAGIENAMKLTSGWKEVPESHLQKGDVVVYKEDTELCGIYDGFACLSPTNNEHGNNISAKQNCNIVKAWRLDG